MTNVPNDAYNPLLSTFSFSLEETELSAIMLTKADVWDEKKSGLSKKSKDLLKSLKDRIRQFHLSRHDETCCYCRRILSDAEKIEIDREHILPKSRFSHYAYEIWNLAASCKTCNMTYKGNKIDFLTEIITTLDDALNVNNYKIIHPNFEKYSDHIQREVIQHDTKYSIRYIFNEEDAKAKYTIDYFMLQRRAERDFESMDQSMENINEGEVSNQFYQLEFEFKQ